jgi:hypothetical protein
MLADFGAVPGLYSEGRMSAVVDRPVAAHHCEGIIYVTLQSGSRVAFPVRGNPRLEGKPHQQLDRIEFSPLGLHWPDLDQDLSIRGILSGDYGQR